MTRKEKYSEHNMRKAIKNASTIKEALENMKSKSVSGNYKVFYKYVKLYNIDTSHFNAKEKQIKALVKYAKKRTIPLKDILVENSTYNRNNLKARLYEAGLKERKCEMPGCGQGEEWMGKKMALIIDHINGVHNDNRIENLRIVCPNCAATLETHCRGKKAFLNKKTKRELKAEELKAQREKNGGLTDTEMTSAKARRKVERPPVDQLKKEVDENGYSATGRKYGVSDNAVRKWLK